MRLSATRIEGHDLTLARFKVNGEVMVEPGASRITIEHNRIKGGYFGIDACISTYTTCDDERIIGNQFIGPYGEDGIRAGRYHDGNGDGVGLLVEGNEFTQIRENGEHSDCIQTVWVGDHLVFRRNYLHDNHCQGFFIKDQTSPSKGSDRRQSLRPRQRTVRAEIPRLRAVQLHQRVRAVLGLHDDPQHGLGRGCNGRLPDQPRPEHRDRLQRGQPILDRCRFLCGQLHQQHVLQAGNGLGRLLARLPAGQDGGLRTALPGSRCR